MPKLIAVGWSPESKPVCKDHDACCHTMSAGQVLRCRQLNPGSGTCALGAPSGTPSDASGSPGGNERVNTNSSLPDVNPHIPPGYAANLLRMRGKSQFQQKWLAMVRDHLFNEPLDDVQVEQVRALRGCCLCGHAGCPTCDAPVTMEEAMELGWLEDEAKPVEPDYTRITRDMCK